MSEVVWAIIRDIGNCGYYYEYKNDICLVSHGSIIAIIIFSDDHILITAMVGKAYEKRIDYIGYTSDKLLECLDYIRYSK